MTKAQKTRNREFLKDLRANEKKAIGKMRSARGGRCCLCVAFDTACRLGFKSYDKSWDYEALPPEEMASFYGWPSRNPELDGHLASEHNDGGCGTPRKSHKAIADLLEKQFLSKK